MGLDRERLLILVLVGLLAGLVVVLARDLVLDGVHDVGHDVRVVWVCGEWQGGGGESEGYVAHSTRICMSRSRQGAAVRAVADDD